MIPLEERQRLRKETAVFMANNLRLYQKVKAGEFNSLTDEQFAEKLGFPSSNFTASDRVKFVERVNNDPLVTAEGVEELITFYVVGEYSEEVFLEKLAGLEFHEGYFADIDEFPLELEPEDYRLGTLDRLRGEQRGFRTFTPEMWEKILCIAESKNIPMYPTDREKLKKE